MARGEKKGPLKKVVLVKSVKAPRHCGRTASYPTAPAQIPACGFFAPGSSEVLASARHSCQDGRRIRPIIVSRASGVDMWFHNPELLNQLLKPSPVIAASLAASVQIFHQQLQGSVKEDHQAGEITNYSIVIEIPSKLGIQLFEQLWQPHMAVLLTPLIEAFQRTSQVFAGCASLYVRFSSTVFPPTKLKAEEVKAGFARSDSRAERDYPSFLFG